MTTIPAGANVQAFIDASADNSEIKFSAGRYALSGVTLRPNRTYISDSNATIVGNNDYALHPSGPGIVLQQLNFEGPAIGVFNPVDWSGFQVDSCRFSMPKQTAPPKGITTGWASIGWTVKPVHMKVVNCVTDALNEFAWIYGYSWDDLEIARCTCKNRGLVSQKNMGRFLKFHGAGANSNQFPEGASNDTIGTSCRKLWVHDCTFTKFYGMCIEYQDGSDGDAFEDLVADEPLYWGTNPADNLDVFGFSLVAARSRNMVIRRLLVNSRQPANPGCFRLAIELGGYNVHCTDCQITGPMNASIAVNGSGASGVVANNQIINSPSAYNANGATCQLTANGPSTVLTWDTTRPYPGSSLDGGAAPPTPEPPVPAPIQTITFTVNADNVSATLSWPASIATGSLQTKTTHGNDLPKTLGNVSGTSAKVKGLKSGWEYDARILINGVLAAAGSARIGPESLSGNASPNNPELDTSTTTPPPVAVTVKTVTTIVELSDGTKTTTVGTVQP